MGSSVYFALVQEILPCILLYMGLWGNVTRSYPTLCAFLCTFIPPKTNLKLEWSTNLKVAYTPLYRRVRIILFTPKLCIHEYTPTACFTCWYAIRRVLYSTYYKPMGDLSYISSEQGGGLIIHTELIYEYIVYKHSIPIQELWAAEGGGLTICTIRYTGVLPTRK